LKLGEGMRFLQAKALQFLASAYVNIGNLDKALSCLRESTRLDLTSVPSLKNISNNYLNIAELYRIRGNHPLALLYAKQSLNFAEQDGDSNRAAQASAFTAVEHAQFEQADEAERQLQAAFRYLNGADKGQRAYTESFVLARAGEIAAHRTEAPRAIEYYTKVLNLLENSEGDRIGLIEARRGRAEAYSQAREFKKARADLEHAIKLIEGYREGIEERDERSNFLDASQAVFDQLILLNQGALARHAEAFDFSEQSRARTLLDEFSLARGADTFSSAQHREKPLKLSEVQRALPPDLRLLAYSVTSERTYMFLVTRDGMEVAESPVTTEILDRLVQEYVSEIRSKGDEVSAKGKALYRYLIAPVKEQLADGKKLCIVPDKALHFLPFASLVDEDGKYLLYYHLSYAPSASTLVRCIEEDRAKGTSKDEKILAVGNPRFNREQFPLLLNLQDAEGEAIESAALYPQKVVLNGADATEARVIAALRDCDVAHLAVHCLVEEKSPWLAALVLAGSDQATEISAPQSSVARPRTSIDDGLLYLNEVYDFTLPRTRLVVISACESGLGQYYRGEGMVSLVRPFLALRVPMVVASLWSIDSKATSDLMTNFHRNRMAANHPLEAGEALRLAQITMAESAQYQHPFYWAPFIAVGSNN
ncbi:MAG: CHAT domain-containing protein, partial [Blastocatellia bacterium]